MSKNNRNTNLTKRDYLILRHIGLHKMTTFAAIHSLFFENKKDDAVKSTLRRLGKNEADLLVSERIPGSKFVYYRLTKKGAHIVSVRYSDELGPSKLPTNYSMLWLTNLCKDGVTRALCKPREHAELFKLESNRLPKVDFYIAEYHGTEADPGKVRLGVAITDLRSRPERIVQRAVKHLRRFVRHGWFDQLILQDCFELIVLTGTFEKHRAIELKMKSLFAKQLRGDFSRLNPSPKAELPFTWDIRVVPHLFDFVPAIKTPTKTPEVTK